MPLRVAALILELLREPPGQRLPELARGGAAFALFLCVSIGPPQPHAGAVALSMVEQGIVELTAAEIEATLRAGLDWTSTHDSMVVGQAGMMVWSLTARIMSTVLTQSPESVAELRSRFVTSGLFQLSLEAMQRFADRGAAAAADGDAIALYFGLKIPNFVRPQRRLFRQVLFSLIRKFRLPGHDLFSFDPPAPLQCKDEPGCEEKIRALAPAIAFCMAPANNLFAIRSMAGTTNQAACQVIRAKRQWQGRPNTVSAD